MHKFLVILVIIVVSSFSLQGGQAAAEVGPAPTRTPKATRTPTLTTRSTAAKAANLRAGPGTNYPKVGGVKVGQAITVTGRNKQGDWLQLASGAWIAKQLVSLPPAALPVVAAPPLPTATLAPPAAAARATVAEVTPAAGLASIRITGLLRDGKAGQQEPDEYVEIANVGDGPQDMTGWKLVSQRGADQGQVFYFPQGLALEAGQTCRVYTNEHHPEWCDLSFGYSRTAVWSNKDYDPALLFDAAGTLVSQWEQ